MNKEETKTVYTYDTDGKFLYKLKLDYTDRSHSGAWQIPANATEIAPLEKIEGFDLYFKDGTWQYVELPKEPEEPEPKTEVQEAEPVDPNLLAIAEALAEQEARIAKLEGGK